MNATTTRAPDYASHSAAPTIQAIILSAQCGILKDFAAFVAMAAFIAAVLIWLPQ